MRFDRRVGLGLAFARSLLCWYVDIAPRPISASYAVTNRCNLRCSYCNTPFMDPTDLPLDRIELIFDRLASLGVKRLGLAGGEPLVRKDIRQIITLAKERGFYVTLNTNLTLYERRRAEVADADLFFTSLDGDRTQHEAARGTGSYDGVIQAIGQIVAEGRPVIAICVVADHSVEAAEHLLKLAESEGFQVHFQPQCLDTAIVRGDLKAELTNDRLRRFWQQLLAEKRRGRPIASSGPYLEFLSGWNDFRRSAVDDPKIRCTASRGFLYIDPQGKSYPCAYTKGKASAVDMLGDQWRSAIGRDTPCTSCIVGPHLEFNLLYQKPVRAGLSVFRSYVSAH